MDSDLMSDIESIPNGVTRLSTTHTFIDFENQT